MNKTTSNPHQKHEINYYTVYTFFKDKIKGGGQSDRKEMVLKEAKKNLHLHCIQYKCNETNIVVW